MLATATAVLLPALGSTSAGAKQEHKEPPSAQATKALAERFGQEALKAEDDGQPRPTGGGRNDCATVRQDKELKALKAKGIDKTSCVQEVTPPADKAQHLVDQFNDKMKKAKEKEKGDVPMAALPQPDW